MVSAVCSDRAPVMLGQKSGFSSLVKADAPHIIVTHCVLHRHALATKTLPPKLAEVLKIVVECVNYVRNSALKHRIFKELCNEMGSEFEVLLYHSNVRWLSREKVPSRVFAMRVELPCFCESTNTVMQITLKILSSFSFWRTWPISSMLSIISINRCKAVESTSSKRKKI